MRLVHIPVTFIGTTTEPKTLDDKVIIGIKVPASFGATLITVKDSPAADGTFLDVYDCGDNIVSFTIDNTAARHYDLTDDFPASVQTIKLVANNAAADGKTITLIAKVV